MLFFATGAGAVIGVAIATRFGGGVPRCGQLGNTGATTPSTQTGCGSPLQAHKTP